MLGDTATIEAIAQYAQGVAQGESSIKLLNDALFKFHEAKVTLCKASKKSSPLFDYSKKVRTIFVDTFTAQGKQKKNIEKMLYPAFLKAVNNGKAMTQINASQEKAKKKRRKAGKLKATQLGLKMP